MLYDLEQQFLDKDEPLSSQDFNRRALEDMRLAAETGERSAEKLLSALGTIVTYSGVAPGNLLSLQKATDMLFPLLRGWVEDPESVDLELPEPTAKRAEEARKRSRMRLVHELYAENED